MTKVNNDGGILDAMAQEVREWAEGKGWRVPGDHSCPDELGRTFGDECALLHSEISEALEAFREHGLEPWTKHDPEKHHLTEQCLGTCKPEGAGSEMADLFIRLLDNCSHHGLDLFDEYRRKMDYNYTRAYRHGGRAL